MIRATTAAAVALLLAGCAGESPDPGSAASDPSRTVPSATATGAATPTVSPTSTESGAIDPSLASAAASLAASAQAQASGAPQPTPPSGSVAPGTPVLGADVSWPQCPAGMGIPHKISKGAPMPTDDAQFVIFGLTNGPGMYPNPCLADQVAWATQRHLMVAAYSIISWPQDPTQTKSYQALREAGYAQAQFNLQTMAAAALTTPIIWLDIEPVPYYDWSRDTAANAAVVEGAAQGYTDAGYRVGVYSTPHLWQSVVGDLSLGGIPEWRAAGETSQEEALSRCGGGWMIQGGPALLGQWVEDGRDRDITCPGAETQLGTLFAQS